MENGKLNQDTEERRRAEEEIRSMALFPDENPNPVMRISANGTLLYSNPASTPLLEYWSSDSKSCLPDFLVAAAVDSLTSGAVREIDLDCDDRIFSFVLAPITNQGYVNLYGRDITKHLHAEQSLSEREAQLRTAFENITEGLVVADLKGNLFYWNPAAIKIHGFINEEEGQRQLAEFTHIFELSTVDGAVLPVEQWPLARILRGEQLRDWEVRVRRVNTDWERVFSYGGNLVRDVQGNALLAVVTVSDITERKDAEQAREKTLRELDAYAADLKITNQNLAATNEELAATNEELRATTEELHEEIAERERAEEALRESNKRLELLSDTVRQRAEELQAVLDSVPAAVWIAHDPQCQKITGNSHADQIMHVQQGSNVSKSASPDEQAVSYKVFRHGVELRPEELPAQVAAATGKPVPSELLEIVFSDGRRLHLLEGAVPLTDAQGRIRGAVAAGADVTRLKQAEERERELEAHKKEFYQRTILAATEGKLVITEKPNIDKHTCDPIKSWRIHDNASFGVMRDEVNHLALASGLDQSTTYQFLGCVVEAAGNAIKHANGGEAYLCRTQDSLIFVVSDTGPGIGALALPDVALTRHYSTAGTLGMGYKLMIKFADRIYLSTGPEGTTVAVEMRLKQITSASASLK